MSCPISECIPCSYAELGEIYCSSTGFREFSKCNENSGGLVGCIPEASKISFVCFICLNFIIFSISFYGLMRKQGSYQPLE